MRIVDLSSELPYKTFLPVSKRKIIITAAIIGVLSSLLIIIDPSEPLYQQAPSPALMILITSIVLILLALTTGKSLIKSIEAVADSQGKELKITMALKNPISGLLQVGELTAAEYILGESLYTSYNLQPSSEAELHSTVHIQATIPSRPVTGLLIEEGERVKGVFRCPALRFSTFNGPEIYIVWIRPAEPSFRVSIDKPSLYLGGAQCSISYGSGGSINYFLSAAEKSGGLFPGRITLKLTRILDEGALNLKHEEVVAGVRGGEVDSGVWRPRSYTGEEVLIVFHGSRRLSELLHTLKMREFVADPIPKAIYSLVLEGRKIGMWSERDIAYLRINSSGEEEDEEK